MVTGASTVLVLGSANRDVVVTVERPPGPGETVLGLGAASYPGGKGLNQVVAAARSGAPAAFVAALGLDDHGDVLASVLREDGIDAELVRRVETPTGQAYIVVDAGGENSIIVVAGANASLCALTDGDRAAIAASSVLLMQLEVPLSVIIEAAEWARDHGVVVMLNAAPAQSLPDRLLSFVDHLIVNEHEACLLGGSDDLGSACAVLARRVPHLVVTLGSAGSVLFDAGQESARIAAPAVTAVDTTGAGDTFCGAFAAAIARGESSVRSARFASAAAALSVKGLGAVPSSPTRARIDDMLATSP